jgi:hypothetical protein
MSYLTTIGAEPPDFNSVASIEGVLNFEWSSVYHYTVTLADNFIFKQYLDELEDELYKISVILESISCDDKNNLRLGIDYDDHQIKSEMK